MFRFGKEHATMELTGSDEMNKQLLDKLEVNVHEATDSLKSDDFRVSLARVRGVSYTMRALETFATDPETKFASYLVNMQLKRILRVYEGRTSAFYELNSKNISVMRALIPYYLERVSEAFSQKNYNAVIEQTADFFNVTLELGLPASDVGNRHLYG